MTNAEKFSQRIERIPFSGCWIWMGGLDLDGYGHFYLGEHNNPRAHRYSYEQHIGAIPSGSLVLHRCDVRPCVNPDHLFLGTHATNALDRDQKQRTKRGEEHYATHLNNSDIERIRALCGTQKQIAKEFGISRRAVRKIKNRESWKHI